MPPERLTYGVAGFFLHGFSVLPTLKPMNQDQKIVVIGTGGTISSRYESSSGRSKASREVERNRSNALK
jgi:L-asparaginase/Glu-tRNA(Gln) amidotransferase subunit D